MIRIHYDYDRDSHHLHITGHAGYAPIGSDIVCAGVSAIACALTECLEALDVVDRLICRTGELKILAQRCSESDSAFVMALAGWKAIQKKHSGYLEIKPTPARKDEDKGEER